MKRLLFLSILFISGFAYGQMPQATFWQLNQTPTPSGGDADAANFITVTEAACGAYGSQAQKDYIEALAVGFKANGTWTIKEAIYPIVGGTDCHHKYNLKDPQNTDAAFRLTFHGINLVHSSTGIVGSGNIADYAETHLIPSVDLSNSSAYMSFNSRTSAAASVYEMGAADNSGLTTNATILIARYGGNLSYGQMGNGSYACTFSSSDGSGYFAVSRDATTTTLYRNGTSQSTVTESCNLSTNQIFIWACNGGGSPGFASTRELNYVDIGGYETPTQVANDNAVVAAAQALLSR